MDLFEGQFPGTPFLMGKSMVSSFQLRFSQESQSKLMTQARLSMDVLAVIALIGSPHFSASRVRHASRDGLCFHRKQTGKQKGNSSAPHGCS
jgi:hypothetical protein